MTKELPNKHPISGDCPAVYVGTYAKYNSGDLTGEWVNLEDFAGDRDGFMEYCAEIHDDESDPELMFQCFQCFPREYYGECHLPEALFDWLDLDENDRELLARYQDAIGDKDATIDTARDCYAGTYDDEASAAEQIAGDTCSMPDDIPHWIVIDWEATWNCNLRHDYSTSRDGDGNLWLFYNH